MTNPSRLAAVIALAAVSATAQESRPPRVEVELNKLEPRETGCQAYLVVRNPGETPHESLRLDLVLFDREGVIARRLAVEAGPAPSEKTSVRAFVAEDVACEEVGMVLLNDVLSCGAETGCLDAVTVSAREPLSFTK